MQSPLTYSWIALTSTAPVVLLLTCWTLLVFHCRRRSWSTMDIFLVAILSQSTMQQFLGFIYSTLVLLDVSSASTEEAVCTGMMWFFISIPIFKGTTIASLAVDRWLYYSRFGYRLSIRKSHIRYHIAVLAILSCTVGFTALITFNSPELLIISAPHQPLLSASSETQYSFDKCTFLPFKFDLKFIIFYVSVHCIVMLVGTIILCKSTCHKTNRNDGVNNSNQTSPQNFQNKKRRRCSPRDVTPTLSNTSTASSSISDSAPSAFFSTPGLTAKAVLSNTPNNAFHASRRAHHRHGIQNQGRCYQPYNYRLSSALGLVVLSILFTHLPFTVGTILTRLGVLVPYFDVELHDDFFITNWPVTNIILWCQVVEGLMILLVLMIVDNIVPSWIFNRAVSSNSMKKNFPEICMSREKYRNSQETLHSTDSNMELNNIMDNQHQYSNAAFTSDIKPNNKFPITNGSLYVGLPISSCPIPTNHFQPINSSINDVDNFYRVLECNDPTPRPSRSGFHNARREFMDESEYDKRSYHQRYSSVASVTTVANDDFEYHLSRPSILPKCNQPHENLNGCSTYVVPKLQSPKARNIPDRKPQFKIKTNSKLPQTQTARATPLQPAAVSPAPTSLSMNDLDLIDNSEPRHKFTGRDRISGITGTLENAATRYESKRRIYRKRGRMPLASNGKLFERKFQNQTGKSSDAPAELAPYRRVLSMECLSPSNSQTDHRNFLDISYLDTGDILVHNRKSDSSKCVFVTDFI